MVECSVVERPTGSFSFGAGFLDPGRLRRQRDRSSRATFSGAATRASRISVDFGGKHPALLLQPEDPYFLDSDFSLGVTASSTST